MWSFPGGHIEPGETAEQALARELVEEIGVTPRSWEFLLSLEDRSKSAEFHIYLVWDWQDEPVNLGHEHSELRWVKPNDAKHLPRLALPGHDRVFETVIDRLETG